MGKIRHEYGKYLERIVSEDGYCENVFGCIVAKV